MTPPFEEAASLVIVAGYVAALARRDGALRDRAAHVSAETPTRGKLDEALRDRAAHVSAETPTRGKLDEALRDRAVHVSAETPDAGRPVEGAGLPERFNRVDALDVLAERYQPDRSPGSTPAPGPYEVVLHVTPDSLAGQGEGELQDGCPVPAGTARRIACHAPLVVMVEDEHGTPLDVGRRTRRISYALQRALWSRDRGCRFPGCANTLLVDAHHVRHWADGGPTRLDDLLLLCRAHHRFVHDAGGVSLPADGGAPVFFDALGRWLPAAPAPAVPDASRLPAVTDPNVARPTSICPKPDYPQMVEGLVVASRLGMYATVPPRVPPGAAEELGVRPARYWLQG